MVPGLLYEYVPDAIGSISTPALTSIPTEHSPLVVPPAPQNKSIATNAIIAPLFLLTLVRRQIYKFNNNMSNIIGYHFRY